MQKKNEVGTGDEEESYREFAPLFSDLGITPETEGKTPSVSPTNETPLRPKAVSAMGSLGGVPTRYWTQWGVNLAAGLNMGVYAGLNTFWTPPKDTDTLSQVEVLDGSELASGAEENAELSGSLALNSSYQESNTNANDPSLGEEENNELSGSLALNSNDQESNPDDNEGNPYGLAHDFTTVAKMVGKFIEYFWG